MGQGRLCCRSFIIITDELEARSKARVIVGAVRNSFRHYTRNGRKKRSSHGQILSGDNKAHPV